MATSLLYVVRHGRSTWNDISVWQGQADPPLTSNGLEEAKEAAKRCPDVTCIVSSDLRRAETTADVIAGHLDVSNVRRDQRLRERDIGPWSGLTTAEIDAGWPLARGCGEVAAGSEPPAVVDTRVRAALHAAIEADGKVLVVPHAGVLDSVARICRTAPWHPPNLGGYVLGRRAAQLLVLCRLALRARSDGDGDGPGAVLG